MYHFALDSIRQTDHDFHPGIQFFYPDENAAVGVRDGPFGEFQVAQIRLDAHGAEAGRSGVDAEHGAEKLVIRAGAPGVAVAAGRFGVFGEGGQAHVQHGTPVVELGEEGVAEARFFQSLEKVKAEVKRRLRDGFIRHDFLGQTGLLFLRQSVRQHGEDIGVLAETGSVGRVGEQAPASVPAKAIGSCREAVGELGVVLRLRFFTKKIEKRTGLPQGVGELQRENGRTAAPHAGRYAANPLRLAPGPRPVREIPPFDGAEHAVVRQALLVPGEHVLDATPVFFDESIVPPVHPVVVNHGHPEHGVSRNHLHVSAGVAALRQPVGDAAVVEILDGLAHEAVIAAAVERDERLDAGVADVLELLVVRAVEVVLTGAEAGRAPAHFPDFFVRGVAAAEKSRFLERVAVGHAVEVFQHERFAAGFDVELQEAPGAEPQRAEQTPPAAVGREAILHTHDLFARHLVAVALLAVLVEQRFGVGEGHFRAFAAADDEFGGGVGQVPLVEQETEPAVRPDFDRRISFQKFVADVQDGSQCAVVALKQRGYLPYLVRPGLIFGEKRNLPRHEHPVAVRAEGTGFPGEPERLRIFPVFIVEIRLFPTPGVAVAVHVVAVAGHDVGLQPGPVNGQRAVGFVFHHLPGGTGVHQVFGFGVALQDEAGLVADLGERFVVGSVPDEGSQGVFSFF